MEWSKVLKRDAWSMSQLDEELPGALFLSYEDLYSDLKQCFLYCSLIPKGYQLCRDDLIRFWVAEGFVKTRDGDNFMEDLAEDYCKELITRNLLETSLDDTSCSIHDLLRSLALFLTRDESIVVDNEQLPNINPSSKIRRLSILNIGERLEVPNIIKQQNCLRTLIILEKQIYSTMMFENKLSKNLRFLRVMDLYGSGLESLPNSIGDLLLLRYLDLDRTKIKKLPESIGCLIHLQVLNLSGCQSLHVLPKAITKLCNLRCLRLGGTPLTHMPKGIGKLKHLNRLEGFVIGHDDRRDAHEGCDLKELQSLSQLRFLEINRLERTKPGGAPILANSTFLGTLTLKCKQPEDEEEAVAIQRIDKIYDELSPRSTHLQELKIYNFFGTGFPNWMMSPSLDVSFPNLVKIMLSDCKSCPQLPPLGLLPQLKSIYINRACAIKIIGPEFLIPRASSAATSFPKLEDLKFEGMLNWEEWLFDIVEGVGEEKRGALKLLPHLKYLYVADCPKLRALPPLCLLPQLKHLFIRGAHAIKTIIPKFLGLRASSTATSFPKLEELQFEDMLNWEEWSFDMIEGVGEERREAPKLVPHLMKLKLDRCPKLKALPEGLRHATNLQNLEIKSVYNLKQINNLPLLKYLEIGDCPRLEHVENLDKLQTLRIRLCHSTETSTTDADGPTQRLPRWLLELLQTTPATMQSLKEFQLMCSLSLLKTFLKDGPNWPIIQPIPFVFIITYSLNSSIVCHNDDPPTFEAYVVESEESMG